MSRVTPAGHRISGAAEPDLAYVAERAASAAARARGTTVALVAAARNVVELAGPGSSAAAIAWAAVASQARALARLQGVASDRARSAGIGRDLDDVDRVLGRELPKRGFAVGEHVVDVDGLTAVALLGVLVDRDDAGGDLAAGVYQQPVGRVAYVSPGRHATRVTTVPPPRGEPYYVLRRTR
jgi:hypothetical protein